MKGLKQRISVKYLSETDIAKREKIISKTVFTGTIFYENSLNMKKNINESRKFLFLR